MNVPKTNPAQHKNEFPISDRVICPGPETAAPSSR